MIKNKCSDKLKFHIILFSGINGGAFFLKLRYLISQQPGSLHRAIAIYTCLKKDPGTHKSRELSYRRQWIYGALIGITLGFYDGFFGPGTGSFFVPAFVVMLGFQFAQASAYATIVNGVTNISAMFILIRQGNYTLELALRMAILTMAENVAGSKLALKKGNDFVRLVFLVVVMMSFKYGWEVFVAPAAGGKSHIISVELAFRGPYCTLAHA
jgi:uncharacterized membrane protein YfcA